MKYLVALFIIITIPCFSRAESSSLFLRHGDLLESQVLLIQTDSAIIPSEFRSGTIQVYFKFGKPVIEISIVNKVECFSVELPITSVVTGEDGVRTFLARLELDAKTGAYSEIKMVENPRSKSVELLFESKLNIGLILRAEFTGSELLNINVQSLVGKTIK